jgi:predicted CoA-binding protein/GNAT superfamily N-acetyltransferase
MSEEAVSLTVIANPVRERRSRPPSPGLARLFSPKAIAVIGASEKTGSVGRAVLENLAAFPGAIFPVNPNYKRILEKPCAPNITAVDADIDLAVIATPATTVPEIVRDCVKSEIPTAIILSAGFKECGEAGQKLESEILAHALGRMRILGPNCLGAMMPHNRLNASFAKQNAKPGNIALLSQSGALCTSILDWSFRENVGFSGFVSVGSMSDVHWGDLIDYFAEDSINDGKSHVVGVGRLTRNNISNEAEFALLVGDEWQGHGLGTQLLKRLVEIGRREKLERITALILEENVPMRRLAEKVGFTLQHSPGECMASLDLRPSQTRHGVPAHCS